MNIVFIAPPAAGKGTFSSILKEKYNYLHISTGDVLREEIASSTTLGKEVENVIKNGKLVDDELMKRLIESKLSTLDINDRFIMDGYPRTLRQAKDYVEILSKLNLDMGRVIYLKIDEETGLKRVLGRLTCPQCKKGYNKLTGYNMPKEKWLCDECKVPLESRPDDTEESYKVRYNTFLNETLPIVEYFKTTGNLVEIDGTKDAETTMKEIEKWLA